MADPATVEHHRRALGAYYTPPSAATYMAAWAAAPRGRILEPSAGDGAFVRALDTVARERSLRGVEVTAVEIAGDGQAAGGAPPSQVRVSHVRGDFLALTPEPHDAVIGNPPYVRLRHLARHQQRRALTLSSRYLGHDMDPAGSVWMPFVLHATHFLRPGGRLALVLPYEVTYVRYARALWAFLAAHYGSLHLVRVWERVFPDILQDVVLLFADRKGATTSSVRFDTYERLRTWVRGGSPDTTRSIPTADVVAGRRSFVYALLPPATRSLVEDGLGRITRPVRDLVTFNIGYVAGDKRFFHPEPPVASAYGLPERSLHRAVVSSRKLRGQGLWTSRIGNGATASLFLPEPGALSSGEQEYIADGERRGVDARYKCRVRDPWYVVPHVRVPGVLLSVFANEPLLMVNDGRYVASNSLVCGYPSGDWSARDLASRWYSSLTLLSAELEVHHLGGGVLVFVPREASRLRVLRDAPAGRSHLPAVDRALGAGRVADAYAAGDRWLTREAGLLTAGDLELVLAGIEALRKWRLSDRSRLTHHRRA